MSEMEKILQNWDSADEYLNSKVEENKLPTYTLEEYERVKDSIPVGTKFIITDDEGGDNCIPVPQTAEVGQVLAVKAVDSEGKPIEWETVDKGGGGSETGRVVKTYDIVDGAQIPMQKNVRYPCHLYWDTSTTSLPFGEYASVDDSKLYISYLHPSTIGTGTIIRSSVTTFTGVYDDTTGMFTINSSVTDYKLMI